MIVGGGPGNRNRTGATGASCSGPWECRQATRKQGSPEQPAAKPPLNSLPQRLAPAFPFPGGHAGVELLPHFLVRRNLFIGPNMSGWATYLNPTVSPGPNFNGSHVSPFALAELSVEFDIRNHQPWRAAGFQHPSQLLVADSTSTLSAGLACARAGM